MTKALAPITTRPIDLLAPKMGWEAPRTAIAEGRCVAEPIGCEKPLPTNEEGNYVFGDVITLKEYFISGMCPECQRVFWASSEEDEE